MLTFLLLALGVVVIAGFVWHFRRQAAAREAASAERMQAFLEQARAEAAAKQSIAPAPATVTPQAAAPAVAAAKVIRAVASAPVSGFALRAPMLDAHQQAMYQALKSAMPDHEILACVSLAAFIQCAENVTGFAREAQERRLADAVADFVVCDRAMNPLAAVQCGARSGKAAERATFAAGCAAAIGVRWVEISPQALPQPAALRLQVLGA